MGTLLNKGSKISDLYRDTLAKMRARNIPYTVATGRTLQAATAPIKDHHFTATAHPQKWRESSGLQEEARYSHHPFTDP
jgi:hypothetical protein